MALSILPDIDAVAGILTGEMLRFHNHGTHSLVVGIAVAFIVGIAAKRIWSLPFMHWFILALVTYELHIVMDLFTASQRGMLLLWPLSSHRFVFPIKLFYGLRWSNGIVSIHHLWTIATEVAFVILLGLVIRFVAEKRIEKGKAGSLSS